jgi:hypothetical protein
MRTCQICFEDKPVRDYTTAMSNADGLSKWCRECLREYQRLRSKKYRRELIKAPKYLSPVQAGGWRPRSILPKPEPTFVLPPDWNPSLKVSFD